MATIRVCDMCGAHFDVIERLNDVDFTDSTGYMERTFDLCNECYHLLLNIVKSFTKANIDDVIKALDEMEV